MVVENNCLHHGWISIFPICVVMVQKSHLFWIALYAEFWWLILGWLPIQHHGRQWVFSSCSCQSYCESLSPIKCLGIEYYWKPHIFSIEYRGVVPASSFFLGHTKWGAYISAIGDVILHVQRCFLKPSRWSWGYKFIVENSFFSMLLAFQRLVFLKEFRAISLCWKNGSFLLGSIPLLGRYTWHVCYEQELIWVIFW